jgi:hypothetical protein
LYLLVPSYSGVQDFWVLPCTALYCDVSTNGKSRNCCVVNYSMIWFILVHTSTYSYIPTRECVYQYILAHTCTYLHVPAHTCTYRYILVHTRTYKYIPVHTSTYLYRLVCTGMYFLQNVNSEIIVKQVFVVRTAMRLCFQDRLKDMFLWSRVPWMRIWTPILASKTRNFSSQGPTQRKWKRQLVSFWMTCQL